MKIQLASDFHLEFLQHDWIGERIITPFLTPDIGSEALVGDLLCQTYAAARKRSVDYCKDGFIHHDSGGALRKSATGTTWCPSVGNLEAKTLTA